MTPELSHRLGDAVGAKAPTPEEQAQIVAAADTAETWDDLPADVQALVVDIESRPDVFAA